MGKRLGRESTAKETIAAQNESLEAQMVRVKAATEQIEAVVKTT